MPEIIEQYQGYQTMDSQEHPVVQKSKKAIEILAQVIIYQQYCF